MKEEGGRGRETGKDQWGEERGRGRGGGREEREEGGGREEEGRKGGGGEGIEDRDISSDLELWYHIELGFRSPTLMASNRTGMLSVWKRTSRGVPLSQSSSPRM